MQAGSEGPAVHQMPARRGGSKLPWVVLAVVVILVLGYLFRDKLFTPASPGGSGSKQSAKLSGYQSVFLTNGQVYFGKLSNLNDTYLTLKDIYYLQVTQPPLQGSQNQPPQQPQAQPQLQLVKLGQELHGPVDEMKISRSQVLFIEDMKDSARVVQAIREYQKNPPASTPAPAAGQNQQQSPPPPANPPAGAPRQ